MEDRTDLLTASRVDLAIILLPMIGARETVRMLVADGVRRSVIERVLLQVTERRPVHVPAVRLSADNGTQ